MSPKPTYKQVSEQLLPLDDRVQQLSATVPSGRNIFSNIASKGYTACGGLAGLSLADSYVHGVSERQLAFVGLAVVAGAVGIVAGRMVRYTTTPTSATPTADPENKHYT